MLPQFRVVVWWLVGLLAVAAVVGGGVVAADRKNAEADRIRADATAFERSAAREQDQREQTAAEQTARRLAAADRAAARQAAKDRMAAEVAARQQAAAEKAARQQATAERAARRRAAAEEAARRADEEAAAAVAAAGYDLTGEVTLSDVDAALLTRVGAEPGQPLAELARSARAEYDRLRSGLAAGKTYTCPAGAGGTLEDLAAGAAVTVRDGSGAILASTSLTGGRLDSSGCTLAFEVHLPDADAYRVQLTRRAPLASSREELAAARWTVSLTF